MVEETVVTGKKSSVRGESVPGAARKPVRLPDIDSSAENRVSLGNAEVDRIRFRWDALRSKPSM